MATQPKSPPLDSLDIDCERHVLPNGLVVLLHRDPHVADISLTVCYRVGSKDEGAGQTGTAHLFEHLMFTGSANLPGAWGETMKAAGAVRVNAMTTRDRTCFYETVPPGALAFALYAEADRMGSWREHLDEAALAQQKAIVIEEKAQREAGPLGVVDELVGAGLYPVGHPYRHTIIGSVADISAMSLADARAWHQRYYAPDNAVILIAGPIDTAATLALVDSHFSHIPASGVTNRHAVHIPDTPAKGCVRIDGLVGEGGMIEMIWPALEASDPSAVRLDLLASLLGGGELSPLHRGLVTAGQAIGVSASFLPGAVCSQFQVTVYLPKGGSHREVAAWVRIILADALSGPGDAVAVSRLCNRHLTSLSLALDSFDARVGILLDGEMLAEDPLYIHAEAESIANADVSAVLAEGRRWLSAEPFVLEIHHAEPGNAPAGVRPARPAVERADRLIAEPHWTRDVAANGLTTVDIPRDGARDFAIQLELAHGNGTEDDGERGITALVSTLPFHGIGDHDPEALHALGEEIGLQMSIGSTATRFSIYLAGPASAAATAVDLLVAMVTAPRFDAKVLEDRKAHQLRGLDVNHPDPMAAAGNLPRDLLYGAGTIETRDAGGTPASIATIDVAAVTERHQRLFDPQGAILLLAGDPATLETIRHGRDILREQWRRPAKPLGAIVPPAMPVRPSERIHFRAAGSADQAMVTMAQRLPVIDGISARETALALGALLRKRLDDRLREELCWTYGVGGGLSEPEVEALPPHLAFSSAVTAAQAGPALLEMRNALAALAGARPPTMAEIEEYRTMMRTQLTGEIQFTQGLARLVARAVRAGASDAVTSRILALDALDPDAIVALAREAMALGQPEWVVASTAPGVGEALAACGLPVVA